MAGYLPLRFALTNALLVLSIIALLLGGYWIWLALILIAIIGSPADEAIGDTRKESGAAARVFVTANLYATLPLTLILTVVFLHYWTDGDPIGLKAWLAGLGIPFTHGTSLFAGGPVVGATLLAAVFYALAAVTVAHELIHWTNDKVALATGRALFGFSLAPGFSISHVYGHHRNVGTPKDFATARRGERLIFFAWRVAIDEQTEAFDFEAARLRRKGFSPWSWRNRFLRGCLYLIAFCVASWWLAGWTGLLGFFIATFVANLIHRVIDYVQHYGLVRVEGAPIEARHAWDTPRAVSNALFYNLPRHSQHHTSASRRAWELVSLDEAPMLPHGYKTMLFVAMIPPLFHRKIDPILAEWDRTRASPAELAIIRQNGWEIAGVRDPAAAVAPAE